MVRAHEEPEPVGKTSAAGLAAWVPGTQFSTYEIESLLATGGMAEVWRAKMKGVEGFERRVVIKTMLTTLQHRPELVEMFVSEASLSARLSHPNIVDVFDFGQLEGRYFIAMSYVPGLTLRAVHRHLLARGERMPIAAALHIVRDICEALQHIHEMEDGSGPLGLVHRDLSPDNIIISTSGAAKLIDFGAARATARTPPNQLFVGRFRYAAPERIRHEGEDGRSDVYSAGVVLYECLTGVRPFNGTDADVVKAVTANEHCDPRLRVPSLPANIAEMVKKATAREPRDRFASARQLGSAIARALLQIGASSKEREVTAALSAILASDAPEPSSPTDREDLEAVPQAIDGSSPSESSDSNPVLALSELEMFEASGPIRKLDDDIPEQAPDVETERINLPLPPQAFRPQPSAAAKAPPLPAALAAQAAVPVPIAASLTDAVRTAGARAPDRTPGERAVELFDRGIALRAQRRYQEALQAWQQALTLAPDNLVYQANFQRLRAQLGDAAEKIGTSGHKG
ncbi:MAG TPA: protein kinase [Polyangia bacterium]|jgi:serine/threonine-protein kinase